jgi:hypothetical protein
MKYRTSMLVANVMSLGIQGRKQFVVECKRCSRDVPVGVKEFPFQSLMVTCPLCDEQHRYLPSEVFQGRPHDLVGKQTYDGRHPDIKAPPAPTM